MYAAMSHWTAHLHKHITVEQSLCDRRLLMTDTWLILSGAKGGKGRAAEKRREK